MREKRGNYQDLFSPLRMGVGNEDKPQQSTAGLGLRLGDWI